MTRGELASIGAAKVRKDAALFALFKKYLTEDAAQVFPSGRLPNGCFGCSFSTYYRQWQSYVLNSEKKIIVMDGSKTYKLKNSGYRVYFGGNVLSKDSLDSEWVAWIQYAHGDKRQERKDKFGELPEALRAKPKEAEPKANTEEIAEEQPKKKRSRAKKSE